MGNSFGDCIVECIMDLYIYLIDVDVMLKNIFWPV